MRFFRYLHFTDTYNCVLYNGMLEHRYICIDYVLSNTFVSLFAGRSKISGYLCIIKLNHVDDMIVVLYGSKLSISSNTNP